MFSARALHATLFSEFGGVDPQGLGSCPVVSRLLPPILSRVLKKTSNGCNPRVGVVLSTPTTPSIGSELPASAETTWLLLGALVPRTPPYLSFHVEVVWVCDVRSLFQRDTEFDTIVHTSHSFF